ncbi:hypothetical protein D3C87_1727320 [compost metagenome]
MSGAQHRLRSENRRSSKNRPVLQDKSYVAIIGHDLLHHGMRTLAVRALIIEVLNDRSLPLGISDCWRIAVKEHVIHAHLLRRADLCGDQRTADRGQPTSNKIAP